MRRRLTIRVDEVDLRAIESEARRSHRSVPAWIRQTLRVAVRLSAIRAAAEFEFPTDDLDRMLGQIESGYPGDLPP